MTISTGQRRSRNSSRNIFAAPSENSSLRRGGGSVNRLLNRLGVISVEDGEARLAVGERDELPAVPAGAQLQAQIQRVSSALYRVGKHPSTIIKGIKCTLNCLGICDDFMAEPFHRFRPGERVLVETRLREIQAELADLKLYP